MIKVERDRGRDLGYSNDCSDGFCDGNEWIGWLLRWLVGVLLVYVYVFESESKSGSGYGCGFKRWVVV